jgi:hypothetical protein
MITAEQARLRQVIDPVDAIHAAGGDWQGGRSRGAP